MKRVLNLISLLFFLQVAFGQVLIKDINIGSESSNPSGFVRLGRQTFFIANDYVHGYERWVTDGSELGTTMVKDIYPGLGDGCFNRAAINRKASSPQVLGKNVYFFATDGVHGFELWRSDGTAFGTTMMKDIMPGLGSSSVDLTLVRAGNYIYFAASDASHGIELWKTDGTDTGTVLLKDLFPGPQSGNPLYLFADSDVVYFAANDKVNGYGLWKSNGTEDGTVFLKNVAPSGDLKDSVPYIKFNGELYFGGVTLDNGTELWKTNGTPEGTILIRDINPGKADAFPLYFNMLNNHIVFSAVTKANGKELWQSDGTEAGTTLVKDINPGKEDGNPGKPVVLNNHIYFVASDSAKRSELWMSDLTDTGTHIFYPAKPIPGQHFMNLFADNGWIYFTTDSADMGFELWRSDGTTEGTRMLTDICQGPCSSEPAGFYKSDTTLFFSANDGTHGNELWSIGNNINFIQRITSEQTKDLYLDPLKRELNILRKTGSDITYIKIFDLRGSELYTQYIKDPNQISSDMLKPGIYILRSYDQHDDAVSFARFVKE